MSASLGTLRAASSSQLKAAQAKRLREAAEIIANAVRIAGAKCGRGSKRIPASVKIMGGVAGMWVTAGGPDGKEAPNAYPFEVGSRHPLFGMVTKSGERIWAKKPMPHVPFLEEGAEAGATEAAEAFSAVIDDWCKTLNL